MTDAQPLDPIYLHQARALGQGGDLLPGGPEALARRLQESAQTGKPLNVKLGLDPTRPDLHLGHSVVLRKLRAFQDLGHQAVLIIGDATAMIGDPTGRNATRPPLTEAEVAENAETYLAQASKIIDVDKAKIVRNSEWLSPLNLSEIIKLAGKLTVAQMLTREDFANRLAEQRPISLHELLYPMLQAYDSVVVEADIELGGSDQRFNNLLGRDLQAALAPDRPPQMVLLMPLLEGTDGKVKMSKTYAEHCINLTATPDEMFGKLMSIPDALIVRYEALLTNIDPEQLARHEAWFATPATMPVNPRDLKLSLASWVVAQYHGAEAGQLAQEHFIKQFSQRQIPEDLPEITLPPGDYPLVDLLVTHNLQPSKGEARRLIQGGGLKRRHPETPDKDPEKLADPAASLQGVAGEQVIIQVGKRVFVKLNFN